MTGPRISRFDHAVIAVRNLDAASASFGRLGFGCTRGGRHTGRGTENAIIPFGPDYLELITVYDEELARAAGGNVLDLVNYLNAHTEGGVGFALAVTDAGSLAATWPPDLPPVSAPFSMERLRPDGHRVSWQLVIPGGSAWRRSWPFFIQWDTGELPGVDDHPTHPNGASRIAGVGLVVRDAARALDLYVRGLGLEVAIASVDEPSVGALRTRLELGGFHVDLLQPSAQGPALSALEREGEGLFQIDLAVSDLARAAAITQATPAGPDAALVSSGAAGVRVMLVPDADNHADRAS